MGVQGSWFIIGCTSCSTVSGNRPKMKIAATNRKIGMSRYLFSLMGVVSPFLGVLPYMMLIRRKR